MLSQTEYEDTLWKYNNIPQSITGKNRKNIRQLYRKKLIEHQYASTYPPFQSSPYELIFLNFKTPEKILNKLINIINSSSLFVLDTESVCVFKQENKSALIQFQIITRELNTYILIIEIHHLPKPHTSTFALIKTVFESLFQSSNQIYVWGLIEELANFTQFGLFTSDQIHRCTYKNLQHDFKLYWQKNHSHDSIISKCICEQCLGIQANNPWSIQDAVGHQLHKWLDKRLTRSPFDIGLDPNLVQLNSNQVEYRQMITRYAADDCDAMFQLLISMDLINQQQSSPIVPDELDDGLELLLFDIDQQYEQELLEQHQLTTTTDNTNNDEPMELSTSQDNQMLNTNNDEPREQDDQRTPPVEPELESERRRHRRPSITEDAKRIIHNRGCTLRQRRKYYRHEIIRNNFDPRFTVRNIKDILRQLHIPVTAVNFSQPSPVTGRRKLYIGIKNSFELKSSERKIYTLFTREHYEQFKHTKEKLYRRRGEYNHDQHYHRHDRYYHHTR
ncbi:unnamed protein product [Adineta steineri]|uniref:Uncharacterized protein n=1 Tax=Adineta steineri TaxID=433720 RepID=A0A814A6V3_9BILA|nr:unnamed protein product [Adineta steineri]CAF4111273.1 unnamed protein product [Adineta steineri]